MTWAENTLASNRQFPVRLTVSRRGVERDFQFLTLDALNFGLGGAGVTGLQITPRSCFASKEDSFNSSTKSFRSCIKPGKEKRSDP